MVETLLRAVANGPIGEKGGIAFAAGMKELLLTFHVKKRFLLAGEAGLRKILCRSTAPYRYIYVSISPAALFV